MSNKEIIFRDLVRDIQEFKKGKLKFSKLAEKYPNLGANVLNLATNWVLTGEK